MLSHLDCAFTNLLTDSWYGHFLVVLYGRVCGWCVVQFLTNQNKLDKKIPDSTRVKTTQFEGFIILPEHMWGETCYRPLGDIWKIMKKWFLASKIRHIECRYSWYIDLLALTSALSYKCKGQKVFSLKNDFIIEVFVMIKKNMKKIWIKFTSEVKD